MDHLGHRVALAHEWLDARAGSEKVFEALAALFPEADLYALTDTLGAELVTQGRPIATTFLSRIPLLRDRRDLALPLMPLAWRMVTRRRYDLVITSSHACVKGFQPGRRAMHLCYCYAPMRYVWDRNDQRQGLHRFAGLGPRAALRRWDRNAAQWVDGFAAISSAVQQRIEHCYGRTSRVIHPPVDTTFFNPGNNSNGLDRQGDPFVLACSRFVPYKRLDIAIQAAGEVGIPLVVAGRGPGEEALRRLAVRARVPVTFEVSPSDERLRSLYRSASAFIFPALEDFGIVAVEAQACGTPVVALDHGGTADTVVDGLSGALVASQDVASFATGLRRALELTDPVPCVANAAGFSHEIFATKIQAWVSDAERGCLEPHR